MPSAALNRIKAKSAHEVRQRPKGIIEFSPISPGTGVISAPQKKCITPKIPDAAPAPPFLEDMTIPKPTVWQVPIMEQKIIRKMITGTGLEGK